MTCNSDGTLLFAASEVGPWVYIVSKNQWFDLSGVGAPQQTYWSVDFVPALNTARFGTYGRGIWDFKIATYNGIEDIVAGHSALGVTAYPNPCRDQLSVSFTTDDPSKATITVMNLEGRILQTIHPVVGSTTGISLAGYASGIYLVTVSDGKEREAVRVVKEGGV
jgi:hypothetical protein